MTAPLSDAALSELQAAVELSNTATPGPVLHLNLSKLADHAFVLGATHLVREHGPALISELKRLRAEGVWTRSRDWTPEPHTRVLICGGTHHYTSATYPSDYQTEGVREAWWENGEWRSQGEGYEEYLVFKPIYVRAMPKPRDVCHCAACLKDGAHWSSCAVHNEPAEPNGPCDCGLLPAPPSQDGEAK